MTSSVSTSTSVWPPMTTQPIAWLVAEPTPLVTTSGTMPATNASVVIRIGRSRSRLAWTIGVVRVQPGVAQLVGVVDLQNRVLLDDAEQHQQPERREDVQRLLEDDQRQQRERQRQRQRQQDRDRVQPRLELRRQDQIHEDRTTARTRSGTRSPVRLSSRDRPAKPARYSGPRLELAARPRRSAPAPSPCDVPGSRLAVSGDLPLPRPCG